jgi:hypothetical protein
MKTVSTFSVKSCVYSHLQAVKQSRNFLKDREGAETNRFNSLFGVQSQLMQEVLYIYKMIRKLESPAVVPYASLGPQYVPQGGGRQQPRRMAKICQWSAKVSRCVEY